MPALGFKGGAAVYTQRLTGVLQTLGHDVELTPLSNKHQGFPYLLKLQKPLKKPDIVIADSISGAMFKGIGKSLIIVEHHCVFDPAYSPYRSHIQAAVHELLWRRYEKCSLTAADVVVCDSKYTASSVQNVFGKLPVHVIPAAIDTDYFRPDSKPIDSSVTGGRSFKLLFAGNLIRRKGVDLLPEIMSRLGSNYELRYTSGLRTADVLSEIPNATALGRLDDDELLKEYRLADALLFPTRFEGFGYVVAEAMACGTPVVTTNCSSLPELVDDEVNGFLCPVDNVESFVNAIQMLANNPARLIAMGHSAREKAVSCFQMEKMIESYSRLLNSLV